LYPGRGVRGLQEPAGVVDHLLGVSSRLGCDDGLHVPSREVTLFRDRIGARHVRTQMTRRLDSR
jgi:hypothetical protein